MTKCSIQLAKSLDNAPIFAVTDRRWSRERAHEFEWTGFLSADPDQVDRMVETLNGFDAVIITSVPSKSHSPECCSGFLDLLRRIRCQRVLLHVDHLVASLHRNANIEEILRTVDKVMTHSLDGVVAQYMRKTGIITPLYQFGPGFDYDEHRRAHWKPVEEQDGPTVRWIGRTARWKGPQLMLDFHQERLRPLGFRTIMEGLESGINYWIVLFHEEEKVNRRDVHNHIRAWDPSVKIDRSYVHGEEVHGDAAYLYPPYKNQECLERMSRSGFGSDLYHLPAECYGASIENCHGEVVACGAVPLFHKHFGDHVVHRVTGDPLTLSARSGTLFLDETNWDEISGKMDRIARDPTLRDETREMAFEFWRSHSDLSLSRGDVLKILQDEPSVGLEAFFS